MRGSIAAPGPVSSARPRIILPALVASQFAGGSLWFATNAVMADLERAWGLAPSALGHATSAVQFGFISGTLVFAALGLADRWSASRLFFGCALVGAAANLSLLVAGTLPALLAIRFLTGVMLAGIYPVGLKIADSWFGSDRGHAMGWLVGALVLGTALPHALRGLGAALPWQSVVVAVTALALSGGFVVLLVVGDGPGAHRGPHPHGIGLRPRELTVPGVRSAAFGYFGHMWELYAFWAFVPLVLARTDPHWSVPLRAFSVMAAGAVGCAIGGILARRWGSARIAWWTLAASGACCLVSPLVLPGPEWVVAPFLLVWGFAVVADSPQYSAVAAAHAPRARVGSTLTLMNAVGFALTIVSIELLNGLAERIPTRFLLLPLAIGPIAGLVALWPITFPGRASR